MAANPNSPGGFTSFEDYFNANEDESKKAADRYSKQATDQANAAKNALGQAQSDFQDLASQGSNGAVQPATNVGAGANPGTLANGASNTSGIPAVPGTYSGPGSLGDVSSYQKAADSANTSQETLNQLRGLSGFGGTDAQGNPRGDINTLISRQNPNSSSGANQLSANLIGSAGRTQFDALAAQFNPQTDLSNAMTSSAAEGKHIADVVNGQPTAAAPISTVTAQPDTQTSSTTLGQIEADLAAGQSQDQIVAKYGYAAYDDYINSKTDSSSLSRR